MGKDGAQWAFIKKRQLSMGLTHTKKRPSNTIKRPFAKNREIVHTNRVRKQFTIEIVKQLLGHG